MFITTPEEIEKTKWRDLIQVECDHCHNRYQKPKNYFPSLRKKVYPLRQFCSAECLRDSRVTGYVQFKCASCGTEVNRVPRELRRKKGRPSFCSRKCSGIYAAAHKTSGTSVSKLERWMAARLTERYPRIEFHFNKTDTILAELDIYIPSIKLAFELNGPFHYEPIFGAEKLAATKNNDARKFQACLERGIELCILDTSRQKYFKESTSQPYLDIIVKIIDDALAAIPI